MRVLLVQPDYDPGPVGFRLVATPEPLALELLAAMVPDHETEILDLRIENDLAGRIERFQPDLVAVTALTTEVYAARSVLAHAKAHSPDIFTTVGGQHATLLPADFQLPYVDAICLGEGEFVFAALVEAVSEQRALHNVPNLVWRQADGTFRDNGRDIPKLKGDDIPRPRRDLINAYRDSYSWLYDRPDTAIATGRGCPFRCNFCSVWEFYDGATRQMSAERVVAEILEADTPHVTFLDDNFLINGRREHQIADMLAAEGVSLRFGMECRTDSIVRHPDLIEKWAKLGLENVLLGLEGVSDETLEGVNKKNTRKVNDEAIRILHANGVMIWGAFITHPQWSDSQFQALRDYVDENHITHTQFTVLTPLPGSQLYRDRKHELLTDDYTCFDTLHSVLPTKLPREKFYEHFASLYEKRDAAHIYELVQSGRLTLEQVKFGAKVFKQFSRWENYIERDPILGQRGQAAARCG